MSGSASASRRTGTLSRTADASNELEVVRFAPRNSAASAMSSALRLPAPSSSIAAVRLATPNWPSGSSPLPAITTRLTWTSGTSCASTTHTGTPLASARFSIGGSVRRATGPSAGGFERSGRS